MSQALTRYQVLFDSIRSRRRKPEALTGLDALAARGRVMIDNAKVNLKWLREQAVMIDALEARTRSCSDAALSETLASLRELFMRDHQDEEAVRRALAATREVARRETGQEAYLVQLMGALALYRGRVIEMLTGEGKTLTGSIAAPLIAWRHRHLHVFTVNDYLAKRDAESREPIYTRCGLAVGAIVHETPPEERSQVYARSIVYGTPKQIVADYLRDQLRLGTVDTSWSARLKIGAPGTGSGDVPLLVPGLRAALMDEADAVLIDEAVVPLIIARTRQGDEMGPIYHQGAAIAAKLDPREDFVADQLQRRVDLTAQGRRRALEAAAAFSEPIWRAPRRAEELIRQALVARHCYIHGRQYQILDGRVAIVDEYTGRFLPDRQWEHGLHQAVEAKEGLDVTADRETLARISFQRFFRMYPFLCGMTGTVADAKNELETVYRRKVTLIPTNRPVIREQHAPRVFRTSEGRWNAVVESIETLHQAGRPVLVGTRSIQASELLSGKLAARGLEHRVLNANFDKDEATIISRAGESGSIVVATNMAGRGTDILLDGEARSAGGLHVILTEMHGAKRIDRQFIGRAGRQGDPGSARIFLSLEDELVRLNARLFAGLIKRAASQDELSGVLAEAAAAMFRLAQRASEGRDRSRRSDVLRQDDWIDKNLPGV